MSPISLNYSTLFLPYRSHLVSFDHFPSYSPILATLPIVCPCAWLHIDTIILSILVPLPVVGHPLQPIGELPDLERRMYPATS